MNRTAREMSAAVARGTLRACQQRQLGAHARALPAKQRTDEPMGGERRQRAEGKGRA